MLSRVVPVVGSVRVHRAGSVGHYDVARGKALAGLPRSEGSTISLTGILGPLATSTVVGQALATCPRAPGGCPPTTKVHVAGNTSVSLGGQARIRWAIACPARARAVKVAGVPGVAIISAGIVAVSVGARRV